MFIVVHAHQEQNFGFAAAWLSVRDPVNDSISPWWNTIQAPATYDSTRDVNSDGQRDEIVTITNPYRGEYWIRLIPKTGMPDTAKFTMSVRINGNQQHIPDDYQDATISSIGTIIPDSVGYTVCTFLTGDVNADGKWDASDIIYTVNYVFKSGQPPPVEGVADVQCDGLVTASDIIYMVNFVFKSGPSPCSQSCE
jgi:hypothetical protein